MATHILQYSQHDLEYPDFIETTGYGTGEGLCGWNCRHGFQPWTEGLKNPWRDENGNLLDGAGNRIDDEENKKRYELQQKQRYYERAIRKTKRQLAMKQQEINGVAETDVKEILQPEYDKLAYKLREQNQEYNEFCEKNGLQKQYDRIKVSGFGRKQSSIANGRASIYKHIQKN